MTQANRGLYGDPQAAARVLAALGGASAESRPTQNAPPVFRGYCGNRAHHNDRGCQNEAASSPNPLRLCDECLAKYKDACAGKSSVKLYGNQGYKWFSPMLPTHKCAPVESAILARIGVCGDLILDMRPCGTVEADVLVCGERRVFRRCDCHRHPDRPTRGHDNCQKCRTVGYVIVERIPTNCGARFALDRHGQRVLIGSP